MTAEQDRKSDFSECYTQSWPAWGSWQTYAKDDLYSMADNAWTKHDIQHMRKVMPEREIMSFNLLRRFVRRIANFERNNRTSVRFEPVEAGDDHAAAQFTQVGNDCMARGRGYHTKSDCFEGALKTGMNLFNMSKDRSHRIWFERYAYNQFVLHPPFAKRDLSDCQWGILRKQIVPSEAKMFFPDAEDMIDALVRLGSRSDDKFPNMPQTTLYGKNLLNLDEWTRRTVVKKRFLVDARMGYVLDQQGNRIEYDDSEMQRMALVMTPTLDVIEESVRTVEVTQYLNGEEMAHGIDLFGIGDFSFTPYMAFFDPEIEHFHLRIQGVLRGIKDSQRTFDRRTIANIRTLEAVMGGGLDVEEGALVDKDQAYTSGQGPRFFTEGAIAEGRFRDRPAPNLPSGWLEMQQAFAQLPGQILNIGEDADFGMGQKDQLLLGVVGKMRLGLGLVGMFDLFDNKSLADQVVGMKLLKLIQTMPADKIQRICGEAPAPLFFCRDSDLYDVIPCETTLTDSQRTALYTELVGLKTKGAEIGDPFPATWSDIMEYAPTALHHKVMAGMQAKEKAAQEQQAKAAQLQEAVQTAALQQIEMDNANAAMHVEERAAKVVKTKVDTAYTMQEMQTQPKLDMLDRAIEMEKINAQKQAAKARPKGNGK